jgi:hypothetical protein
MLGFAHRCLRCGLLKVMSSTGGVHACVLPVQTKHFIGHWDYWTHSRMGSINNFWRWIDCQCLFLQCIRDAITIQI